MVEIVKFAPQKLDGKFTPEYLEQQKQLSIETETKKYLLETLTEMLILDEERFLKSGYPVVNYFIIYNRNRNITPILNPEYTEIYERLSHRPEFERVRGSCWYFLMAYQDKTLSELKEEYKVFNGVNYVTLIENNKAVIVPEQPKSVSVTVTANLDCEAVLLDTHGQCPDGYVYSGLKGMCVKLPEIPKPVSTLDKTETNTKTMIGNPVMSDNKVFKVKL